MNKVSAFKNKEVRRAINYAIDKEELVTKIERGAAVAGSAGILPPAHLYYNPAVKQYEYNPARAQELLETAGQQNLSFKLKVANSAVRLGELLKQQLARVGIEVTVISSDRKTHDSQLNNLEYEVGLVNTGGWGGEPDYLIERFSEENLNTERLTNASVNGYNNPEGLLKEAKVTGKVLYKGEDLLGLKEKN